MIQRRRGWRRGRASSALAVVLALCLAVVAVSAAVHSVHHGADADAATCPVFVGTQHTAATAVEPPVVLVSEPAPTARVALTAPALPPASPIQPVEGRSPPARPTA
jgi:hypothetical protein